jgi:hypothetical protein
MVNKAADLRKADELSDAISSSIKAIAAFSTEVERKQKQEDEQKKAKPKVDESKSV